MTGSLLAQLQPNQVLGFVLLDIAIILVVARLMGALARKVGQPTVVGEIVAGVLLGPTLLGTTVFAWDAPWGFLNCDAALEGTDKASSITSCFFPPQSSGVLGILGQIALVFFMFLVGLELDFDLLKGKARSIALVAIGVVVIPIALGFLIGPALYGADFTAGFGGPEAPDQTTFVLFVAAMLSVTAFPVMARILQEKGLTTSPMGSVGIAAAAVVTVLMFLAVAVATGAATDQGPASMGAKFAAAGIYLAVMFLVVKPALAPLGRAYEQAGQLRPGIFATVIVMLFASSYAAHQIGINVIVGGFVAGAVLPARKALFRDMASRLSDLTAVILLPIFLAFSGLNTDFTTLGLTHVPGLALFLAAGIVGKWLGGAVSARIGGLTWREGNLLGILMNCRGLLVLVVALIALNEGVISQPMQAGGVVMALVTTMMTGPLFDRFSQPASTAGAPPIPAASPGTTRVLAVAEDPDDTAGVAHAAYRLVADRPDAEVVLGRMVALPAYDELPAGIADSSLQTERSLRSLHRLAVFAPAGVAVTPVAVPVSEGAPDLMLAAAERDCDAVVTPWSSAWDPADVVRFASSTSCVTVLQRPGADGGSRDGPAVLVGTSTPIVADLARRLAGGLQPAVVSPDDPGLLDALAGAGLVIVPVRGSAGQPVENTVVDTVLATATGLVYVIASPEDT